MALRRQGGRIDHHAVAFDAVQGLAALHFQLVDEAQLLVGLKLRPQHAVHVQRLVGVFARIFGGLGDVDLVELDLVRALAAQVFVVDAAAAHVPLGQAGQAVRFGHFQHIALQHGVVRIALHFHAVVGEHMAVVFDVLAQLGLGRVFQPGFEARQHLVARQLRGRVGVVVRERDVGRFAGRDAETQADDFGQHFVERGGFGVQRDQFGRFDLGQPAVEGLPGQHRVVVQVAGALGRRGLISAAAASSNRPGESDEPPGPAGRRGLCRPSGPPINSGGVLSISICLTRPLKPYFS